MNTIAGLVRHKPLLKISNNAKKSYSTNSRVSDCEKTKPSSFQSISKADELPQISVKNSHQMTDMVKSEIVKESIPTKNFINSSSKHKIFCDVVKPRKNDLNIQMLSETLYQQVFKKNNENNPESQMLISKAQEELKQHGLWTENISFLPDVSLDLPPLKGKNIEEHFWNIGSEQANPYKELLSVFTTNNIPIPPKEWLCQKGWTKYEDGKAPVSVPFPEEEALVFDVEVCVKLGGLPTLATAVSNKAWYAWISSDLADGINPVPTNYYTTDSLIPLEGKSVNKETPRIIIGHNVSYDRARIKEQYYVKNSALRFLDTMSLHISIGGITKSQKTFLKQKTDVDDFDSWKMTSCLSSLKEVYSLYCNKELSKEERSVFLEGTLQDVKNNFQNLMLYCANDVTATYEILQKMYPIFLDRFPHPVTLAGMLEMGSAFLPVNDNWKKFLADADQTYEDLKNEITLVLSRKSDKACKLFHNDEYKNDLWMWEEDWSTRELKLTKKKLKVKKSEETGKKIQKDDEERDEEEEELTKKFQYLFDLKEILPKVKPFLPGYPLWYRKLCEKPDSEAWVPNAQLSTSMTITPKLLQLTWENFPLYHCQKFGWGILVADIFAENVQTSLPFEALKKLTIKNCNINTEDIQEKSKSVSKKKKNISPVPYYKGNGIWCDHIVDGCCYFFKLPHKDGSSKNVGNPLSNNFLQIFSSSGLKGSDSVAEKVLDLRKKLTYWNNNRERILNQMVVWLKKKEMPFNSCSDEDINMGIIIPMVVVCGTLTRRAMEATWLTASKVTQNRIGSELRSMIQAPPGYHFVGADVDSQELWIASLIGDSYAAKVHGGTPLGWMTLSGTKANGTDMHSMTAKAVGISRDHAKVINYARIYGAGVNFAMKLLQQFNPSMSDQEARTKAAKMYALTKGKKIYKVKDSMLEEFQKTFGPDVEVENIATAMKLAEHWGKKPYEIFEKSYWVDGTESAMFNQLEKIATSSKPVTPFLQCRLSRALEPKYKGDSFHLTTRINWVVQSGAVDFLHLMLVCMKWLTNGKARYCFSFHDEVRYLIPSTEKYNAALAMHITNLLVRAFCAHRLGMHDLPQSVAFFSSVEVDRTLRKEANDNCVTPSNPHGMEKGYGIPPGESLNIYDAIQKSGGSLSPFTVGKNQDYFKFSLRVSKMSQATKRKHVQREVLQGDLEVPNENQQIVRVLGSRGNNLHEVEAPDSSTFLISMPNKFRKNVWVKKGDYILVEPIEEGEKVKAEMVKALTPAYIKFLKKENFWPSQFSEDKKQEDDDDLFVNNNRNNIEVNSSTDESE